MNIRDYFEKTDKKCREKEILFLYVLAGALLVIGMALLGFFLFKKMTYRAVTEELKSTIEEKKEEIPCPIHRFYDGVCVAHDRYEKNLVAIMIENHTDARPQSGLADATIVYEAPVEANFTRFMALYPLDASIEKIGPVRSARPYYLDWLSEFGRPMYMYVGGSPQALADIIKTAVFDINEFSHGWYFWRDEAREAPHNAYTSSKLFQAAWEKYGDDEVLTTSSWQYADGVTCVEDCVDQIKIIFSLPSYKVIWNYNTSTNQFDRYQTEGRHTDAEGQEIFADTVIVQRVVSRVIDEVGRKKIETIGEGEAIVFANGVATKGRWEKTGLSDKIKWFKADGSLILLKPGKIWIEVVGQDSDVGYTLSETKSDQKIQSIKNMEGTWVYTGDSIWSGTDGVIFEVQALDDSMIAGSFSAVLNRNGVSAIRIDAGNFAGSVASKDDKQVMVAVDWEGDRDDNGTATMVYNAGDNTLTWDAIVEKDDGMFTLPKKMVLRRKSL